MISMDAILTALVVIAAAAYLIRYLFFSKGCTGCEGCSKRNACSDIIERMDA